MGAYTAQHQTPAGTNLTILMLQSTAAIRSRTAHLILGSDATPANLAGEFIFSRVTAFGTGGTGLTEGALDPDTVAPTVAAVGGTFTAEPTFGTILLMVPLNQQATFQWWANPGYEMMAALGAAAGAALRSVGHGGTPNMNTTLFWME